MSDRISLYRISLWVYVILSLGSFVGLYSIFLIIPFLTFFVPVVYILAAGMIFFGGGYVPNSKLTRWSRNVYRCGQLVTFGGVGLLFGWAFIMSLSNPNIWMEAAPLSMILPMLLIPVQIAVVISAVILLTKDKQ